MLQRVILPVAKQNSIDQFKGQGKCAGNIDRNLSQRGTFLRVIFKVRYFTVWVGRNGDVEDSTRQLPVA